MATRLPVVRLGHQNVRYLFLKMPDTVFIRRDLASRPGEVPLFMACDVVASQGQNSKNHARFHARLGREGLAAKLDFKAHGHLAVLFGSFWFYSVKGVFKAAFDYLDEDIQRACLQQLTNLWMDDTSGTDFDLLTTITHMEMDDDLSQMTLTADLDKDPVDPLSSSVIQVCSSTVSGVRSQKVDMVTDVARGISAHVVSCPYPTRLRSMQQVQAEELAFYRKRQCTSHDKSEEKYDSEEHDRLPNWCDRVQHLVDSLCSELSDHEGFFQQKHMDTAPGHSEAASVDEGQKQSHSGGEDIHEGFPIHLMYKYMTIMTTPDLKQQYASTFSLSTATNVALCLISDWLGHIFYSLGDAIMQRMEEFKRENISCIDSLPPAKDLVWKLFPQCMARLILAWMRGADSDDATQNVLPSSSSEHSLSTNYQNSPNQSQLATKVGQRHVSHHKDKVYALAQIILEFANNSLLSGVAHVVYSRL